MAIIIDPLAEYLRAQHFCARHGFKPVCRRMFGKDDSRVVRLSRATFEAARH